MSRIVILDQIKTRPVAALIVDGQLEDLAIDPMTDAPLVGAIYRAVADRPIVSEFCVDRWLPSPNSTQVPFT